MDTQSKTPVRRSHLISAVACVRSRRAAPSPAFSAEWPTGGLSIGKRMVPLDVSKPLSSFVSPFIADRLPGNETAMVRKRGEPHQHSFVLEHRNPIADDLRVLPPVAQRNESPREPAPGCRGQVRGRLRGIHPRSSGTTLCFIAAPRPVEVAFFIRIDYSKAGSTPNIIWFGVFPQLSRSAQSRTALVVDRSGRTRLVLAADLAVSSTLLLKRARGLVDIGGVPLSAIAALEVALHGEMPHRNYRRRKLVPESELQNRNCPDLTPLAP